MTKPEEPTKNTMTEAREQKAKNARARQGSLAQQVEAILAAPTVNDELKRKLAYAQDVISGRRTGDVALMGSVRTQYMREALKNLRLS